MSTKIQSEVRSTTFEKAKLLQQTSPRFCFQNVALRILSIFFCMISPTIIQTFYLKNSLLASSFWALVDPTQNVRDRPTQPQLLTEHFI